MAELIGSYWDSDSEERFLDHVASVAVPATW
jgi:hypothetical protein